MAYQFSELNRLQTRIPRMEGNVVSTVKKGVDQRKGGAESTRYYYRYRKAFRPHRLCILLIFNVRRTGGEPYLIRVAQIWRCQVLAGLSLLAESLKLRQGHLDGQLSRLTTQRYIKRAHVSRLKKWWVIDTKSRIYVYIFIAGLCVRVWGARWLIFMCIARESFIVEWKNALNHTMLNNSYRSASKECPGP